GEPGAPQVKLLHPALLPQARPDEWRTTANGLKLAPGDYQAPELLDKRDAGDIRSDLYSLGCVLFHLLAGRPPFADASPVQRSARQREGRYADISSFNSSISKQIAALFPKLLAPNPDDRLASPAKLLHLLKSIDVPPQRLETGVKPSRQVVEDLFNDRE